MGVKLPVRPLASAKADFGSPPPHGNPAAPGLGLHKTVRPPGHHPRRTADGQGHPVKLRRRNRAGQGGWVRRCRRAEITRIKAAKIAPRLCQMPGRAQDVGPILPAHPQQPDSQ